MSCGEVIVQVETSNKDTATEFDQEDEDMFQKLKETINSSNGQGQDSDQVTKIQKVPKVMNPYKNERREYFRPNAIAIGPNYANYKSLSDGKELKLMWAAKYLDGLDQKKILQDIRGKIELLKGRFDEKCLDKNAIAANQKGYVHGTLARMLFVDGCAMLQFIYSFVLDDFVNLKINIAQATVVQQDMFLLENQIPFQVLQIISESKNKQQEEKDEQKKIKSDPKKLTEMETAVQKFIHMSNMSTTSRPEIPLKFDGVVHLLDLLRRYLLDDSAQSDDRSTSALNCLQSFIEILVFVILKLPIYVLSFLVCLLAVIVFIFYHIICNFIDFLKSSATHCRLSVARDCLVPSLRMSVLDSLKTPKSRITRRSFRNVQDLKAAGIELKPSKSRCLKDVSFNSGLFGGCLRLCPILVDKSTAGKLLNLVAYEMCPDYHCKITEDSKSYDYRISSYSSFLDSLIDNEQDVKDLRAAHILRHRLSSDAEVAELFNNIISPISVADEAYGNVKSKIQTYYERPIRIWITEFRREHLSSPWRLVALIAAAAALALTATQTSFAINPR